MLKQSGVKFQLSVLNSRRENGVTDGLTDKVNYRVTLRLKNVYYMYIEID